MPTNYSETLQKAVVLPELNSLRHSSAMKVDMEDNDASEPLVQDPSIDIRSDMENILNGDLNFKGSFSFKKTYTNSPNPTLRVDDLGYIGLPLSTSQAKEVISHSIQAPFGKGERTIVDTTVRDTWEIDASKVHFDNPSWSGFMDGVVKDVCQALGVNCSASQLRCEPYKLLLYETGSHFLPHQDTEKSKGMFATVVVILPSVFTGGAAHLTHGGISRVLDCSADSLYKTSVLSWYTDVTHEIKPITSGYRLAIAYNLIHTRDDLKPVLPDNSVAATRLKHVLLSWKQSGTSMPAKLIYLLQHKYSHASFQGSALKGADAYKAALLEAVGKPLGFYVGLANVECHVSGDGDNDHGHRDCWSAEVEMGEVCGRSVSIEHLVDLQDGHEIRKRVYCKEVDEYDEEDEDEECDKGYEFIPRNLREVVESGPIDERSYEGYQGNGAGSLELYYRRSVLVIWPEALNLDMEYGDNPPKAASFIASTISEKPTKEERTVMELLLHGDKNQQYSDQVLRGLCEAACKWRDLPLWLKAIDLCNGTKALEPITEVKLLCAVDVFGFKNIRPIIENILMSEPSTVRRINFLDSIRGKEQVDPSWISTQRLAVMRSLKAPQEGEESLLLDLAREAGGIVIFKESILPQLVAVASSSFLLSLANSLHGEKKNCDREGAVTMTDIVTTLLSSAITKADCFDPTKRKTAAEVSSYHYHLTVTCTQPLTPNLPFAYIKCCFLTDNHQLVDVIINKITAFSGFSAQLVLAYTKCVLIPLIPLLVALDTESEQRVPGLAKLSQKAVNLYMKNVQYPQVQEVSAIIDAIVICEGWDMIHTLVVPKIKAIHGDDSLIREFIQKLQACGPQLKFPENSQISLASIIADLVDHLITKARYNTDRPTIIRLLNLCFDTHNAPAASKLCVQVISDYPSPDHISNLLMPLLPEIQAVLTKNHISPITEPFQTLFRRTLEIFVEKSVGAKPSNMQRFIGIACSCQYCRKAVAFLIDSKGSNMTLRLDRIGAPNRKHLERELSVSNASQVASWAMISSSPQGLAITKLSPEERPQQRWKINRQRAISTFDAITKDDNVRSAIIGPGYTRLVGCLNGTNTSEPVALSSRLAWGTDIHGPPSSLNQNQSAVGSLGPSNTVVNAQASFSSPMSAVNVPDQSLRGQPPTKKLRYN